MKSILSRAGRLGLAWFGFAVGLHATLVTPPTVDYVNAPTNCNVGDTITIDVGAHANLSDNSDGNDWNTPSMAVIARITIDYLAPGGSWTNLHDWMPTWETPASASVTLTPNVGGTWYFRVQLMDGRPWYTPGSGTYYVYAINVNTPYPTITSSLSLTADQGQSISYQITATNSPTSFAASNLPAGLSFNASTGVISGNVTATGTIQSTISATNSAGTDTETLTWTIAAAVITTNASVSPTAISTGQSVELSRDGSANFGIAWTENTIWQPNGQPVVLGDMGLGTMTYTPTGGDGTYWYQFRLVDNYSNYQDQWISFTVSGPTEPADFQSVTTGSNFITLSWSASSAPSGIKYYEIYRDGTFVTGTTDTSYTDNNVSPGTTYTYQVFAVDNENNESPGASLSLTSALSLELFTPLP